MDIDAVVKEPIVVGVKGLKVGVGRSRSLVAALVLTDLFFRWKG